MYKKKNKKRATIYFREQEESNSFSTITNPLSEMELLIWLRGLYLTYGTLVIEQVGEEGDIHISTKRSFQFDYQEERILDIEKLIRSYIKGQAIPMDAYVVLVDGKLNGVFGAESLAGLKKKRLKREGIEESRISIEPIQINQFQDFQPKKGECGNAAIATGDSGIHDGE